MGFLARLGSFFGGGSARRRTAATSSRAQLSLGDARQKQQAAVQKMRRGVADVSVSRQRLDVQAVDLQHAMAALEAQARASRENGDQMGAQSAMNRHLIMDGQLSDLISQRDALVEQETMLIDALTQLQARAAGFNVTVETLTATHKAAHANQAITAALEEFGDTHRHPG